MTDLTKENLPSVLRDVPLSAFLKDIDKLPAILQKGEEAWILKLDAPLEFTGVEVMKVFHTNWNHKFEENGAIKREPRFTFASFKEGFERRYYIHKLAELLIPEHVVTMRGFVLPHEMPLFFDEANPPKVSAGMTCYPKYLMKYAAVPDDRKARLTRFYEDSAAFMPEITDIIGDKERLTHSELHSLAMTLGEMQEIATDFDVQERRMEPSLIATAKDFFQWGLYVTHPEANYTNAGARYGSLKWTRRLTWTYFR